MNSPNPGSVGPADIPLAVCDVNEKERNLFLYYDDHNKDINRNFSNRIIKYINKLNLKFKKELKLKKIQADGSDQADTFVPFLLRVASDEINIENILGFNSSFRFFE